MKQKGNHRLRGAKMKTYICNLEILYFHNVTDIAIIQQMC